MKKIALAVLLLTASIAGLDAYAGKFLDYKGILHRYQDTKSVEDMNNAIDYVIKNKSSVVAELEERAAMMLKNGKRTPAGKLSRAAQQLGRTDDSDRAKIQILVRDFANLLPEPQPPQKKKKK